MLHIFEMNKKIFSFIYNQLYVFIKTINNKCLKVRKQTINYQLKVLSWNGYNCDLTNVINLIQILQWL